MRIEAAATAPVMAVLLLSACGGGSGGSAAGVVSTPPPVTTPTPPPPTPISILPGLSASQVLKGKGASFDVTSSAPSKLVADDNQQLAVRYDAISQTSEVQAPGTTAWQKLGPYEGAPPGSYSTGGTSTTYLNLSAYAANGYKYSAVGTWGSGTNGGGLAFGSPTAATGVPVSGSANYNGLIAGRSTETINDAWGPWAPLIDGAIDLSFNFGAGTLSGSISPQLVVYDRFNLPVLTFTDTIYGNGSQSFSGHFATNLSGVNNFSGVFTGPNAEELIGKFAFPYTSPFDGKPYEAGGGFVGKRP